MTAFMPARIRGRTIKHAIDDEEGNAGPGAPEPGAPEPRRDEGGKPDKRIADRRPVGAFHQLLKIPAGDWRGVPLGCREPLVAGRLAVGTEETVVTADDGRVHRVPPLAAKARARPAFEDECLVVRPKQMIHLFGPVGPLATIDAAKSPS